MELDLKSYSCDLCMEKVTVNPNTFGNSPVKSWLKLQLDVSSNNIPHRMSLDFCSIECCISYLEKQLNFEKNVDK